MSAAAEGGLPAEVHAGGHSIVFERPAELVDLSERIYRDVFAVGLWVAAALSAFAAAASLLQPTVASQTRGLAACGAFAAACGLAAMRPAALYAALRRHPSPLLLAGAALGAGAVFVGDHNFQLLLPMIAIIGVTGIATPRLMVVAAGLIAAAGLGAPHALDGDGNLGGPLAVLVPPLLFWLIVDRIAQFALRLHQALAVSEAPQRDARSARARSADPQQADQVARLGLPAPTELEVDGIRLTSRQLQVILLACEGLRHAEIGRCLGISAALVRRHLANAKRRTGAATTPQLVAWAKRVGLVPGVV